MSNRKSYWEKLQDPRWQKRRLEVMHRDNFTCTSCGDTESTLSVHHGYYEKGLDPWDYPAESLFTLCHSCHEEAHGFMTAFQRELGKVRPSQYSDVLYQLHQVAHAANARATEARA